MTEEGSTIWTVIAVVLGLILLLVTAYILFFGPGKAIVANISELLGLGKLPKEAQEASQNAFDVMIENIENCKALTETNCLCDVFPSWPATFAQSYKLQIYSMSKAARFNLVYNNKIIKNATIENLLISAQIVETKTNIPLAPAKTIDWKTEPPLFIQEGVGSSGFLHFGRQQYKVVTGSLYKTEQPEILYLLISVKPANEISESELTKSFKKCSS